MNLIGLAVVMIISVVGVLMIIKIVNGDNELA